MSILSTMDNLNPHPYSLQRRKFIRWLAMGAAAIGAPALVFNYSNLLKPDATGPEDELIELCGDKALFSIGKRWTENNPAENNLASIKASLLKGSTIANYDNCNTQQLINFVHAKSKAEFARMETMITDGWVLTQTDCRIAALHFLNHSQNT